VAAGPVTVAAGKRQLGSGGTAGGGCDDDGLCGGAVGVRDARAVGPGEPCSPVSASCGVTLATLGAAARLAPETITRRTRLSVGVGLPAGWARRRFWRSVAVLAPWVFAAPAVAFAFLPAALGADRLTGGIVVTGAVTALTALAGVLIQPAARALDALRWRWSVGMGELLVCAAGLVLGAYAVDTRSLWLLAPCAAVLGCAYGLCLVWADRAWASGAP
jgi:hypothetical protein